MNSKAFFRLLLTSTILATFGSLGIAIADDPPAGWQDTADFSLVITSGNSDTNTLGFKNKLWREWDKSRFEFNAGAIRAESKDVVARFAVGSPGDFRVVEQTQTRTTAEQYFLNGRYDRKITDAFFWFAGAGWDKNEPAGVKNRYTGFGGVGNIWADTDTVKFRTDYALSFTKQDDVVMDPTVEDTFLGARFSWAYLHKFGQNTVYTNDFVLDENLDETSDFRADMTNAVAVSVSERLALKVGLQWLYDNKPSVTAIELFDSTGANTGETVLFELDDLDTIFTASLVVNF